MGLTAAYLQGINRQGWQSERELEGVCWSCGFISHNKHDTSFFCAAPKQVKPTAPSTNSPTH